MSTVQAEATTQVTVDNFIRAETDLYFGNVVKEGGLGKFQHHREVTSIDHQTVIRSNRDTLYSTAVFDLDAGPVTITLPDAGPRFRSMMILDQDHYVRAVEYAASKHTLTRESIGTRYVLAAIRTLVDPADPADMRQAHVLQDAIEVGRRSAGNWEVPAWDAASQKRVRDALLVLANTLHGFSGAFGSREEVDPVLHLLGSAAGWGGNPDRDATYLGVAPAKNDGKTAYRLVVRDVPVDGFWSISVYNEQGYFEKNAPGAYTLNNITAKKDPDGAVTIQFGGCDGKVPNCLPVMKGWNYLVRLYRPRPEILDGSWTIPEATPLG